MSIRHATSKHRPDDVESPHSDKVESPAVPATEALAGLLRDAPAGRAFADQLGAQPRLRVGGADEAAEREADAVARDAVHALRSDPTPAAGLPTGSTAGGLVSRLADGTIGRAGGELDDTASAALDSARNGGGTPLSGGLRQSMESAMGADFGGVRLHAGSDAAALSGHMGAQAFTVGRDVFFGSGMPNVQSADGQHLLAHELTHTIQQGAAPQTIGRQVAATAPGVARLFGSKKTEPVVSAPFNTTTTNTQETTPIEQPDDQLSAKARKGAAKEASDEEARDALEAKGFIFTTAQEAYTKNLFNPVWDGLLATLGLTRGALLRSKEQNAMRQLLKDAARAQANKEIAEKVDKGDVPQAGGDRGKKNFKNKAAEIAYKEAKSSVDMVVKKKAFEIAQQRTQSFKPELVKAGEAAISGPLTRSSKSTIKKAIVAAAAEKQEAVFGDAVTEAKGFVSDLATAKTNPPSGGGVPQAVEDVRAQVTEDNIADKVIEKTIEAQSPSKAFEAIAALIDREIPNEDDECELEISVSLPCGHGVNVDFGYTGSAAREDTGVTLNNQITLGVSWSVHFAEIKGAVGLVLNAKGADTAAAMNLINFGMYQGVNGVSSAAGGYFWGYGGHGEGVTSEDEARAWANDMAERYLKGEDAYVDLGWLVSLGAKFDTGVGDVEAEIVYQNLKRYKEAVGPTTSGDLWETEKRHELEGTASVSLDVPSGLKFELSGKSTWAERALESLEFGASASMDTGALSALTGGGSDFAEKVYKKIEWLSEKMEDKEKAQEKKKSTGQKVAAAEEDIEQSDLVPESVQDEIDEKTSSLIEAVGGEKSESEGAFLVEVGVEIEFKAGKAHKWTVSIDLKRTSSAGFTLKLGGAGAEVKKTNTSKLKGFSKSFGPGAEKPTPTTATTPATTP